MRGLQHWNTARGRNDMVQLNLSERYSFGNDRKRVRDCSANSVNAEAYNGVMDIVWREYRG